MGFFPGYFGPRFLWVEAILGLHYFWLRLFLARPGLNEWGRVAPGPICAGARLRRGLFAPIKI